jgi:hypothetical protein
MYIYILKEIFPIPCACFTCTCNIIRFFKSVDISVCILSFSRSKGHMSTKEPCPMVYHEHFMELFRFMVFNVYHRTRFLCWHMTLAPRKWQYTYRYINTFKKSYDITCTGKTYAFNLLLTVSDGIPWTFYGIV